MTNHSFDIIVVGIQPLTPVSPLFALSLQPCKKTIDSSDSVVIYRYYKPNRWRRPPPPTDRISPDTHFDQTARRVVANRKREG